LRSVRAWSLLTPAPLSPSSPLFPDTTALPIQPPAHRHREMTTPVPGMRLLNASRGSHPPSNRPVPPRALRPSECLLPLSARPGGSEEHTSEVQSRFELVCCLLLEKTNATRSVP